MLKDRDKNMLALIRRSKRREDGWYKVSRIVWPLLADVTTDLFDRQATDDGGLVRLTARGEAVADYLV